MLRSTLSVVVDVAANTPVGLLLFSLAELR